MRARKDFHFGGFRLDARNKCLWHGEHAIKLTPKAFAVLHYLLDHAGQLVTKEELWREVWEGIAVTDAALTMCLSELRKALGDTVNQPQYIATVHRRGYRFIGKVVSRQQSVAGSSDSSTLNSQHLAPTLVGRETELAQLHEWLATALNGERQLVFVTGEPGIGKTALVNAFLAHVATEDVWLTQGHCVDTYGAGEAYLPVLTALDALCRTPAREEVVTLLQQHAPLWLGHLPSLLTPAEHPEVQRYVVGATPQRMLREMANFLGALTTTRPLVLVLEDLHWSDPSTVALLAYLARWAEPLRLLLIGTYRPSEVLGQDHPLATVQAELQGQGLSRALPLPLLTATAVTAYVAQRISQEVEMDLRAQAVYQRTEGNPLFMVAVVDEMLAQGTGDVQNGTDYDGLAFVPLPGSVPERLRQLVSVQMTRLARPEQRVLEAASVTGEQFAAAEVAAALIEEDVEIEEYCDHLVRQQQFLRRAGVSEWPDGTVTGRYSFSHAVYQTLWQERVTAGRWRRYHQLIGERKERSYGAQAREIAAELAVHFEEGRDYHKAIRYLQQAGENASRKSAHREAIALFTKGLALLKHVPNTSGRTDQELRLQIALGAPLMLTKGYAAPEVEQTYDRARQLCYQVGETSQLFPVLRGLWQCYLVRAELQTADELGEQLVRLAQRINDPTFLLEAYHAWGTTLYFQGECAPAREYLEQGITLYDPQQHSALAFLYGYDPGIGCLSRAACALWLLGYPTQALRRSHEALARAQNSSHPQSLAFVLLFACVVCLLRREGQRAWKLAEAMVSCSNEQGFAFYAALGTIFQGRALTERGQEETGVALMRQGLVAHQATKAELSRSAWLAMLTEGYQRTEQVEEGLRALDEALTAVDTLGERWYEAELYRLKGELTLQSRVQGLGSRVKKSRKSKVSRPQALVPDPDGEAEACFLKAIEVAQKQQTKSWELRATTSLARLWQQQGKQKEAHQRLADVYLWFTEGFDTKDLQEAKALLEELHGS
ncbi:MAG: AAA family ATPase [Candidatus Binatia bacterium]